MANLKLTIYLNTRAGIMLNMPLTWYDDEANHIAVVEKSGCVSIHLDGDRDSILEWLFNLGKDGRYKLIFPDREKANRHEILIMDIGVKLNIDKAFNDLLPVILELKIWKGGEYSVDQIKTLLQAAIDGLDRYNSHQ